MKVQNKVVVVTGAGGGIGGEIVKKLLHEGSKVAAVDLREESLEKLKENIPNAVDTLATFALDITDKDAVSKLPEKIIGTFGAVDGLINCAGIIQSFVRINDLDYETIDRVMSVNFYGTLYMTKAFLPHLLERPEAHIANVSSMGGFLPVPGQSIYGASKAAVKLMTEGLYSELLDTHVGVSVVFPGATATEITKNSDVDIPMPDASSSEKLQSKTLPADEAAKIIVYGIEKNKALIFTGKDSIFMNRLYRFNPVFATRFIAKQMKALLNSI